MRPSLFECKAVLYALYALYIDIHISMLLSMQFSYLLWCVKSTAKWPITDTAEIESTKAANTNGKLV
jgi:hypothetical protein